VTRQRRAFCVACGKPKAIVRKGRCLLCLRKLEGVDNARKRTTYDAEWKRIRTRALAEHRAQFGDWCPMPDCEQPYTSDLTVDHIEPRSLAKGTRVLCRSCNTRAYQRQRRGLA
jgi:5-methylcytosine-specific restriction protein A